MQTAEQLLTNIPTSLHNAVQTSIYDANIPKQGPQVLRYVASCELRGEELDYGFLSSAARHIDEWIALQESIQPLADLALAALDQAEPLSDLESFPAWRAEMWGQTLMMPWSENLLDAVMSANEYLASGAKGA